MEQAFYLRGKSEASLGPIEAHIQREEYGIAHITGAAGCTTIRAAWLGEILGTVYQIHYSSNSFERLHRRRHSTT
jgi:hypothetical protein